MLVLKDSVRWSTERMPRPMVGEALGVGGTPKHHPNHLHSCAPPQGTPTVPRCATEARKYENGTTLGWDCLSRGF